MAISVGPSTGDSELNSTINTTPLVDVMLVLLIIFLITVPVIVKTVPVELPHQINVPTQTKPENIVVAIDRSGRVYWNNALVPDYGTLLNKVVTANKDAAAAGKELPEVHIRADRAVRYEYVGRAMMMVQRGGTPKIGFLLEPPLKNM